MGLSRSAGDGRRSKHRAFDKYVALTAGTAALAPTSEVYHAAWFGNSKPLGRVVMMPKAKPQTDMLSKLREVMRAQARTKIERPLSVMPDLRQAPLRIA